MIVFFYYKFDIGKLKDYKRLNALRSITLFNKPYNLYIQCNEYLPN